MAKNNKKKSHKQPDMVLTFSTPEKAGNFCEELRELLPDVKVSYVGSTTKLWAPTHTFDAIKDLSCQPRFRRTACSVHTASR